MNHDDVRAPTRSLSVAGDATWLHELAAVVRSSLWPSLPFVVVGFAALLGCDTTERRDAAERPNIVLILGDDHGYPDFGFMGSPIVQTPNLDRLASGGTYFDSGFVTSSVCLPSHRSLLTGLHPLQSRRRLSQSGSKNIAFDLGESISEFSTLASLLAERGYATFQGGKLWEGGYALAGFSHGTKGTESLSSSFAPSERTRGPNGFGPELLEAAAGGKAGLELGRTTMTPVYEFIDEHRNQPFFVWFAPLLPHSPFDAPEEFRALYRSPGLSPRTQGYYSNISWFDDSVGRLMAHLEAAGLRQKTLVVYLADNGWQQGGDAMFDLRWGGNRGKGSMYELGLRTPVVFSWPGRIPEARVDHNLVSSVDLFSTLLDFAGARQPAGRPGVSLRGLLEGTSSEPPREIVIGSSEFLRVSDGPPDDPVFARATEELAYFLRSPSWYYIWYFDRGQDRLYNVVEDPDATRDLSDEHSLVVFALRRKILQWVASMKDLIDEQPSARPPAQTGSPENAAPPQRHSEEQSAVPERGRPVAIDDLV